MNQTPDTPSEMPTAPHILPRSSAVKDEEGKSASADFTAGIFLIIGAVVSLGRFVYKLTHSWTDGYLMRAEVAGMLQSSLAIVAGILAACLLIKQGRTYSTRHPLSIAALICCALSLAAFPIERYLEYLDRDVHVTIIEIRPGDKPLDDPRRDPDTGTLV